MKSYQLTRVGKLYAAKACIEGEGGTKVLTLLVDTGSTYTIIPAEVLEAVGASPATSKEHVRIVTGSGILLVPRVQIKAFQALGQKLESFFVIAHTLPSAGPIDGLLGMDFLRKFSCRLDLAQGAMEIG